MDKLDNLGFKAFDFIKGNVLNIIVVLTSIAYICYGMVKIEATGLQPWEVITRGGIGIIVGLMIKEGIGENGFSKGYNSNIWKVAYEKYSNACNVANKYIDRVDNFYLAQEIELKKEYRRKTLMAFQMKYDWFFDGFGNYVENTEKYKKLDKKQKKALKKAIKVKIYNLNLFSEYAIGVEEATKKERTDKDQHLKMLGKNSITQIAVAILGAYFTFNWGKWNWGTFIATTIQVCMWIFCGITQLYANYQYIVIDKVNKLKRKSELIIKFQNQCENGYYLTNPYESQEIGETKDEK